MAKSKFRPLHDRVVVKRIDAEEKTKGGIIIPDSAKEKPSQGEITAVGPGGRDEAGKLIPIDLKVGDRVLSGLMMPPLVFSSASIRLTTTRSCSGRNLDLAMAFPSCRVGFRSGCHQNG